MSTGNHFNLGRLDELSADRATQYLSAEEQRELAALLTAEPHAGRTAFDHAAASADLAWSAGSIEPMPRTLRSCVEVQALAWLAGQKGLRVTGARSRPRARRPRGAGLGAWVPWTLAAACLAVAVIGWWPSPAPAPMPADARAVLMSVPGTRTVAWQESDTGITGDVVWNEERQEGYLRFRGLAVNDPDVMQYQLWIFDASREDYSGDVAVDGGVFDVRKPAGDVIVPIRAKLPVGKPTLFAITTEPPGGVVKHNPKRDPDRFKIILTAPA